MSCSIGIVSVEALAFDAAGRVVRIRVSVKGCKYGAKVIVLGVTQVADDFATQFSIVDGLGIWSVELNLGKYHQSIGCGDTVGVYAECKEDPACNTGGTVPVVVTCDDGCPPDGSTYGLEITLPSGDGPYTPFQIAQMADMAPGPGCNIHGQYHLKLLTPPIPGATITWVEVNTSSYAELALAQGVDLLDYDYLHDPSDGINRQVQAKITYNACSLPTPTVTFEACCADDPCCESEGQITDPDTGDCVSPCPDGRVWNPVTQRCEKDDGTGDPDDSGDPDDPGDDHGDGTGIPGPDGGGKFNLCAALILAWFIAYVIAWMIAYTADWVDAGIALAVAAAALTTWSLTCCRRCMRHPTHCCTFIRWMLLAHRLIALLFLLMGAGGALSEEAGAGILSRISILCDALGILGACDVIISMVSSAGLPNPIVAAGAAVLLATWETYYAVRHCSPSPLPWLPSTWPRKKC